MKVLERNPMGYLTPRRWCPREAEEFIVSANAADRHQLLEWCMEEGAELRIRSGFAWGQDYRIAVVTFSPSMATRFQGFMARFSEQPAPKVDLSVPIDADPLAAWAVAELAEMRARQDGAA